MSESRVIERSALHDRVPIADLIMTRGQVTGAICFLSCTTMVSDSPHYPSLLTVAGSVLVLWVLYLALYVGITVDSVEKKKKKQQRSLVLIAVVSI